MIIDAHQHFWKLSRGDYGFPHENDRLLYRDFLPHDLAPHLAKAGVQATIAVQATESVAETEFLLGLSRSSPFIAGVVGWCDLKDAQSAAWLETLSTQGPLVGIRPMLQAHDNASWLLSDAAQPNLKAMASMRLVFEALVDVRHLDVIDKLAEQFPELQIVVDHLAKPWRDAGKVESWKDGMQRLARHPNCFVKLSGIPATDANSGNDISAAFLIGFVADKFGADRLMWGSDWPVSNRHGAYSDSFTAVRDQMDIEAWTKVSGTNARDVYHLKV